MERVFGVGEETEDWTDDCTAHVNNGIKWHAIAKSHYFPDDNIQYTIFHPRIMKDEELFWGTLIHEICENDLVALLLNNIVALLNNEDTAWQSFATITHYCTVHALNEPNKDVTLPW